MTSHEIRPKQLRMLLLLLVLVPLIPCALMVRFMVDTLKVERLAALERMQQFQTETLASALRSPAVSAARSAQGMIEAVLHALGGLGPDGVTVTIVDATGRVIGGEPNPSGQPLAQGTSADLPGTTIQLHLAGPEVLDEAIAEQRRGLTWVAVLTILSVIAIAGAAAFALHHQIALRDLKNTSVATVAHELRTPLASIRMLVDTLRERRYRGEHQLHEYLDLVASEIERLSRLAESFLSFSRLQRKSQAVERTVVTAQAVVDRAVAPLRIRLDQADCVFTEEIAPDLPPVSADGDALAQVLSNLLDNALKYSEEEKKITLRAFREGPMLCFAVEDNGRGIPESERRSIFQPFYQIDQKLSRSREGCGLGLAIARRIVEAHRGKIDVASEPGKGSVFTVSIPAE